MHRTGGGAGSTRGRQRGLRACPVGVYCTCGTARKRGRREGGVGRKGREMATHQFDAAARPLCPPKQCAQSQPGVRLATAQGHTDRHTLARTRRATPRRRRPCHRRNRRCPHSGAASPRQTTPGDAAAAIRHGRRAGHAWRSAAASGQDGPNADVPVQWCKGLCRGRTRARENRGASPVVSRAQQHPSSLAKKLSCAQDRGRSKLRHRARSQVWVGTSPSSAMQHVNDRCDERPPSVRGEGACRSLAAAQAGPSGPTAGWAPCVQGRAGNLSGRGGTGPRQATGCVGGGGLVPEFLKILPSGPFRSRPTFRHPLASPPVSKAVLRGGRRCVGPRGGKRPPQLGRIRGLLRCGVPRASRPREIKGVDLRGRIWDTVTGTNADGPAPSRWESTNVWWSGCGDEPSTSTAQRRPEVSGPQRPPHMKIATTADHPRAGRCRTHRVVWWHPGNT